MQLITQELERHFRAVGDQDIPNPIIICKLFNPCGGETWYLTAYYPEKQLAFGYMTGGAVNELGYVSIDELEAIELPLHMKIERDLYFLPCRLDEIRLKYTEGILQGL